MGGGKSGFWIGHKNKSFNGVQEWKKFVLMSKIINLFLNWTEEHKNRSFNGRQNWKKSVLLFLCLKTNLQTPFWQSVNPTPSEFRIWTQWHTRTKKHDSHVPCKILYVARFPPYAYFLHTKPSSRTQAVTHHVSPEPSRPIILSQGFG